MGFTQLVWQALGLQPTLWTHLTTDWWLWDISHTTGELHNTSIPFCCCYTHIQDTHCGDKQA